MLLLGEFCSGFYCRKVDLTFASAETKVQSGVKVYLVSIMVQGVALPPPPTIVEEAVGAVLEKGKQVSKFGKLRQSLMNDSSSVA